MGRDTACVLRQLATYDMCIMLHVALINAICYSEFKVHEPLDQEVFTSEVS